MKLGARRIDFIGMKFQFADEVVAMYASRGDTTSEGHRGGIWPTSPGPMDGSRTCATATL